MTYALGHSPQELKRLQTQADLLRPFTRQLIADAGVTSGMTVLDLGCGAGDAAFLLADAVGREGRVVGVDRELAAIEVARERAAALGYGHLEFVVGDETSFAANSGFDAVFARYVLIHQPDPVAFVRDTASLLKPGGIFISEEAAFHLSTRCWPAVPLWNAMFDSIAAFTAGAFPNHDAAGRVVPTMEAAGLTLVNARATSVIGGGQSAYLSYGVATYKTFLPVIERMGFLNPDVGDPNTIERRIEAAITNAGAQFAGCPEVGAWARSNAA